MELADLDADIAGAEAHEANIGTVVDVTLPDGVSVVRGTLRGRTDALDMAFAGYAQNGGDELMVRLSQFAALTCGQPTAKQVVSIRQGEDAKEWMIEGVDRPDGVVIILKLKPNW